MEAGRMIADIVDYTAMQIVVFIGHLLGLHYHPWLFEVFIWLRLARLQSKFAMVTGRTT
jgi:hypothetical protein